LAQTGTPADLARRPRNNQPPSKAITKPAAPAYQRARVNSAISVFVNTFDDMCRLTIFHCPPDFAMVALQRKLNLNGPRMTGKNLSSMLPSAIATSPPEADEACRRAHASGAH
jgi:hypothetical protein